MTLLHTSRGPKRWFCITCLLLLLATLQTAYAIGVDVTASAEQVCGDEFSHRLMVSWSVTDESDDIQVEITVTLPDGTTQSSTQTTTEGSVTFNLTHPGGGSVNVQVSAQEGGSSSSASATASLTPCEDESTSDNEDTSSTNPDETSHEDTNVTEPTCPEEPINYDLDQPPISFTVQELEACDQEPNGQDVTLETGNPNGLSLPPMGPAIPFDPNFELPRHDLIITDIEVSQGMQNLENEMPLVRGRNTIVRVYVKDVSGLGAGGVTARLRATAGVSEAGNIAPSIGTLSPMNKNGRITVKGDGGKRENLEDSFWFFLPSSWIKHSQLSLIVEINTDRAIPESDTDNNSRSILAVFHDVEPFYLRPIPLHMHPGTVTKRDKEGRIEEQQIDPSTTLLYAWDSPDRWNIYNNIYRFYPISELIVKSRETPFLPDGHEGSAEWDLIDSLGKPKAEIDQRIRTKENLPQRWHYVGLIKPGVNAKFSGLADRPEPPVSWVIMENTNKKLPWDNSIVVEIGNSFAFGTSGGSTTLSSRQLLGLPGGSTLAHELGHNQGQKHILCKGNEESGGPVDKAYPYDLNKGFCRLAKEDPRGFYGLDVYYNLWNLSEPAVISNEGLAVLEEEMQDGELVNAVKFKADGFPLMGYKWAPWTDPWTYCKFLNRFLVSFTCNIGSQPDVIDQRHARKEIPTSPLKTHSQPQGSAQTNDAFLQQEVAVITGTVNFIAGTGEIHSVVVQPASNLPPGLLPTSGEVNEHSHATLELVDFRGTPLLIRAFNVQSTAHDDQHDEGGTFSVVVELPEGVSAVVLKVENVEVARKARSPHAPNVNLSFPNQVEALTPDHRIEWNASDDDGDTLTSTILYSPDAQSWEVVAEVTEATSIGVDDLERLTGSDQGLIRIFVSDGFNSAQDESDHTFSVAKHPPIATILSVSDTSVSVGSSLFLSGVAEDLEDLAIGDAEAYQWESNLDGLLGTGPQLLLDTSTLSVGTHELTLTVTDSDGMTTHATSSIVIEPEPERDHLDVQVDTEAVQTCDTETESHFMSVGWIVSGGALPVSVTIAVTAPDGTVATIENHPLQGRRDFQMGYLSGGEVSIQVMARDANNASSTAQAIVRLEPCSTSAN